MTTFRTARPHRRRLWRVGGSDGVGRSEWSVIMKWCFGTWGRGYYVEAPLRTTHNWTGLADGRNTCSRILSHGSKSKNKKVRLHTKVIHPDVDFQKVRYQFSFFENIAGKSQMGNKYVPSDSFRIYFLRLQTTQYLFTSHFLSDNQFHGWRSIFNIVNYRYFFRGIFFSRLTKYYCVLPLSRTRFCVYPLPLIGILSFDLSIRGNIL